MRSPAWPSHSGGPSSGPASSPRSAASTIGPSASGSTSRFVPWVMVTGRSVFGRSVRHGMPQHGRLLLDAAAVGDHERRAADQGQELQVAERVDDLDAGHVQEPRSPERGPAPRVQRQHDRQTHRRARAARPPAAPPPRVCPRSPVDAASRPRSARGPPGGLGPAPGRSCPGGPARCRSWDCRPGAPGPPSTPSWARLSRPSGLVTNRRSESTSVTRRLISSGMVTSKLRRPASTCATGTSSLAHTSAAARVEFTSP